MNRRNILLIDSDQSTRRQRVVMLLTHGYAVRAAKTLDDLELPFTDPLPDLVLLRAEESPNRPSAYELIRKAVPGQSIGVLPEDGHKLCQLFMNGVLTLPRTELAGDLIQAVEAMFETQFAKQRAASGS